MNTVDYNIWWNHYFAFQERFLWKSCEERNNICEDPWRISSVDCSRLWLKANKLNNYIYTFSMVILFQGIYITQRIMRALGWVVYMFIFSSVLFCMNFKRKLLLMSARKYEYIHSTLQCMLIISFIALKRKFWSKFVTCQIWRP